MKFHIETTSLQTLVQSTCTSPIMEAKSMDSRHKRSVKPGALRIPDRIRQRWHLHLRAEGHMDRPLHPFTVQGRSDRRGDGVHRDNHQQHALPPQRGHATRTQRRLPP